MSRIFNVDSSNKYLLRIEEIKTIEDAGDDFMTQDELSDMLNVPEHQRQYHYWNARTFREELIREELAMWKSKIPAGQKSVIIKDDDLIEALKESYLPISHYVKGLRRVGDRLFAHEVAEKVDATKRDHQNLINCICYSIRKVNKFTADIKYSSSDYEGSMKMAKLMIQSWDKISFADLTYTAADQLRMKQIWDNPAIFN